MKKALEIGEKVEEMLTYLQGKLDYLSPYDASWVEEVSDYFYENGRISDRQVVLLKQVFFCLIRKE